ncbi:hypothetical protein SO802_025884 [Lithocarpus litseifolius]|uniref:Auxin-responsive protein n=1 Tax=Lithocarpus litseifolius TaxID=425828 RepID=A0AAW2C1D3_9ROSI
MGERYIYIGDLYHRVTTDDSIFSSSRSAALFGTPYKPLPFPSPFAATPAPITSATAKPSFLARSRLSASIKADHVNLDRVVESGATRMSEKEEERRVAVKKRRVREAEEVGDAMKSAEENVTLPLDSKRELDEMKSMEEKEPVEEDEAVNISISHNSNESSQDHVRRIHDNLKVWMFVDSCKRLKIMKGSDAIGLGV